VIPLELRGGEPRAADTATPPRPTLTIHQHRDDSGPFWVVTCSSLGCPESPPFDGPNGGIAATYWEAAHDLRHEDEFLTSAALTLTAIRPDRGKS
jgi:hypothetical protein